MPDEDDVSSSSEESDSSSEEEGAEVDKKKAEVRKRLEEASKAKRAKKGFMTPERKKKLRLLLRKKAAEELKKEQERKAAERRRIIDERCGYPKDVEEAEEDKVREVCHYYHDKITKLESQKWDLEFEVRKKEFEINELNIQVNDLRGKFIKPSLKKVSKYENKFAKLQKKAAEFNFRNNLKQIKKKEFTMEDEEQQGGELKRGLDKFGEKQKKKKKPAEGEDAAEEEADDDDEEEEEGPTFKMRIIFHDKSKWCDELLDHETEEYQEFVTYGEDVLSNILPQVDGLRGYTINDIEKVNDRICTHGEGPMFADVDIEAAKAKCTHIMQQSLRSDSKTVSEEMCANFNENTYGLTIDFFDPPRCLRIQMKCDAEKLEYKEAFADHESEEFQALEEKLHQATIKPLKEVGGVATKSFKLIGVAEKGKATRQVGDETEEYTFLTFEADIATDRHIHTDCAESAEKVKEKLLPAVEDEESDIGKLVNKEAHNLEVTVIDPNYVEPAIPEKVLRETKVEVKLVLDQKEWNPDFDNPESEAFHEFMAEIESMFSPAVPPKLPTPPPSPPREPSPPPAEEEKPAEEEPKPEGDGAPAEEGKPEEGAEGEPKPEGEGEEKKPEEAEPLPEEAAPPEEPAEPEPEPEKLMSHMPGFKEFHGMKLTCVDGKVCVVGDLMVDTIKECHMEGESVKTKVEDEFKAAVAAEHSIMSKLVKDPAALTVESSVVKIIDPDAVPEELPAEDAAKEEAAVEVEYGGAGPEEEPEPEPAPAPAPAPAAEGEAKPADAPAPAADAPPADAPPADAPPADAPPADAPPAEETPAS